MQLVRAVWVVSVLAVVVTPASQGRQPVADGPAQPVAATSSALPSVRAAELVVDPAVAGPALFSFDDLRPGAAPGGDQSRAGQPAPPPRPPKVTVTGRDPRPGTPQAVLAAAYRAAARTVASRCHLGVWHLAAIGQIESGSVGGRSVVGHRVSPAIYGPLLDGGPFAVITDSDGGRVDGAGDYDRAVGPLQFLPGTWRWAGRDGDADGVRDPQNVFDAAAATAGYLCREGRDLSHGGDLRAAFWSYNQSADYVSASVEWASFFKRNGLAAMNEVAFRVGSGGRASDLGPAPGADGADAPTSSTTTAPGGHKPSRTGPATGGTTPRPSAAPVSAPTPTSDPAPASTTNPVPDPTPDPPAGPTPTPPPSSDGPSDPAPPPTAPPATPTPSTT